MDRKRFHRALLIFFLLSLSQLLILQDASAWKLYKWTDKKGQDHITDYPPPNAEKKEDSRVVVEEVPVIRLDRTIVYTLIPYLSFKIQKLQKELQKGKHTVSDHLSKGTSSILLAIGGLVILHFYYTLCLYLFSRKIGVSSAWLSWMPIFNVFTLLSAAGKPWWWAIPLLLPLTGFTSPIYSNIYAVMAILFIVMLDVFLCGIVWMRICVHLWINRWFGLLIFVPLVQLILIGYLAFKSETPKNPP